MAGEMPRCSNISAQFLCVFQIVQQLHRVCAIEPCDSMCSCKKWVTVQRCCLYCNLSIHLSIYGSTVLCWSLAAFQFLNPLYNRYSDWLRAGRPRGRSSSPGRVKNVLFSKSSRLALGSTQPPIQWVSGLFPPRVKRPGHAVDHSPPASAKVKKMWIYTSIPPYAFMA
jgi:hypothetical protein